MPSCQAIRTATVLSQKHVHIMIVRVQVIVAEVVTWTAGFVFLTLVINASILPWVLSVTGLNAGAPCACSCCALVYRAYD